MRRLNTPFRMRFAALLLVLAALGFAMPSFAPTVAYAQERVVRRPWSLFDLFVPRRFRQRRDELAAPPRASRKATTKARKSKSRIARNAAATPTEPDIVAVEKQPDARVVLVVGDFLASGLAEGLDQAFARNAGIRVLDRAKGSSGFVRNDVFDWPAEIAGLVTAEKAVAVVVMLGSNDRQQFQGGDKREAVRSDAWTKAYEERAAALAEALEKSKVPFVWVSMPPFKSAKMSSDMLAFNTIYKSSAEAGGGEFIDIWDGFADEAGNFIASGPDVSGQPVRLRGNDGINLSKAGKVKAAFYVEKPLRKLLGLPAEDGAVPSAAVQPLGPVAPVAVDRTEPISLSDPNLDGATELLGASAVRPVEPKAVSNQTTAPTGRADNFMAPPPAIIPPTAAQTAVR